ncbi:hypothetical protein [Arthrobacter psychrolactophilus]
MVVGVVCAVIVIILSRMWLRRGRKIRAIKSAEKLVRDNENAKLRAAKKAAKSHPVSTNDAGSPTSSGSPTDTPEA